MSLWNSWHRAMMIAAGVSVLAACYAVSAWGQTGVAGAPSGAQTVTVASLQIPPGAWHHFEKAKSAASRHRDDEYERESAKALEMAPGFAQMYLLRATVQLNAHQYEAALASVQAAEKADPAATWISVVFAGVYNGMHRFNDALLALDSKHGAEAETWQALYEHARAEIGMRDTAAGLNWSGIALRAAPPEFADAHLVRANALMLAGRQSEAATQMDLYLQSKGPQTHRSEVVAARDAMRSRLGNATKSQIGAQAGGHAPAQVATQFSAQVAAHVAGTTGTQIVPQPGSKIEGQIASR